MIGSKKALALKAMRNKKRVRLTEEQIKSIKEAVHKVLGSNVRVIIFGSRADLSRKGGDIDILVLSQKPLSEKEKFSAKLDIMVELYKRLGERKIDLIVTDKIEKEIEKEALRTGVEI